MRLFFRLDEPAADLAVTVALVSSLKDIIVPDDILAFGEVGLTGEIRSVNQAALRVNEASRLGFKKCILPYHNINSILLSSQSDMELIGVRNIREAVSVLAN